MNLPNKLTVVRMALVPFFVAALLLSKTNDPVLSYAIIALSLLFICALIVLLKKVLIENPVIKFISNILFKKGG